MPHVMNISYTDAVINILVMKKLLIYCSIVLVYKFADNLLFYWSEVFVIDRYSALNYLSRDALQFTFSFALDNCGAEVLNFNFSLIINIKPLKVDNYHL